MESTEVANDIPFSQNGPYKVLESLELLYGDLNELKDNSQKQESEKKPLITNKIILMVISIFSFTESITFIFFLPKGTGITTIIFDFSLIFSWMTLFNIIFFIPNSKALFLKAIKKLWFEAHSMNLESLHYLNHSGPKPRIAASENERAQYTVKLITIEEDFNTCKKRRFRNECK